MAAPLPWLTGPSSLGRRCGYGHVRFPLGDVGASTWRRRRSRADGRLARPGSDVLTCTSAAHRKRALFTSRRSLSDPAGTHYGSAIGCHPRRHRCSLLPAALKSRRHKLRPARTARSEEGWEKERYDRAQGRSRRVLSARVCAVSWRALVEPEGQDGTRAEAMSPCPAVMEGRRAGMGVGERAARLCRTTPRLTGCERAPVRSLAVQSVVGMIRTNGQSCLLLQSPTGTRSLTVPRLPATCTNPPSRPS